MRNRVQLTTEGGDHAVLDDRIALLSVLQELTVAVLKLFDPASPLDDFLEKVTARLGCHVTLCVSASAPGQPITLRGSSGLARSSRDMQLPDVPAGGAQDAAFPYPELRRPACARWAERVGRADDAFCATWLLLWFEREPRSALQYRGVLQTVAHHLGLALAHREMVAQVVESERALQRLNLELECRVDERAGALASANAELRRQERSLRTLGACNEALVRAGDEQALLDAVCRIVVEIGGHRACWIGFTEGREGEAVRPAAVAGRDDEGASAADLVRAEVERGDGQARRAIGTGRPSLERGATSSECARSRPGESSRACASTLALPLVVDGETLGALVIHADAEETFDPDELKLLAELAANAAFGIGTQRARSQQLRMAAQLAETDRLAGIGTLAAGIAHEINNPLTYVIGGLDFLSGRLGGLAAGEAAHLDEVRLVLQDVVHGADRIRKIVRDLKTFSRGGDEPRRLVDLQHVLESSAHIAYGEIRHRARFLAEYGPTPSVLASESRLGQVFLNLLINAAHSIPEGAVDRHLIRVRAETEEGGHALVEISDTGCGMPPDTARRVFEPFFTTKPVGVGTGLGLSICRNFVTEIGGTIEVESEVGKGSVFRVRLPPGREDPEEAARGEQGVGDERRAEPAVCRGRILVVDDELPVGAAVQRVLAPEHEVVLVTSAVQATERIALGERFDVIVCDLMMPALTGMDLHADLLRRAPDQAERMVLITGGAVTPRARQFLGCVANPRLEKPFRPTELRETVNRLLSEKGCAARASDSQPPQDGAQTIRPRGRTVEQSVIGDTALLAAVLDSYPAPSLLVDEDVRCLFINRSARRALGFEDDAAEQVLLKRGGHLLHCIHAGETPEGCGRAPACRVCVIRTSVNQAFATKAVHRARAFLELESPTGVVQAHFLVSTAPVSASGREAVILTLEDISSLVKLTSLLPICYQCRKVRNERDYWQTVEDYFKEKADIDFSHALCADCLEKHYPKQEGN